MIVLNWIFPLLKHWCGTRHLRLSVRVVIYGGYFTSSRTSVLLLQKVSMDYTTYLPK